MKQFRSHRGHGAIRASFAAYGMVLAAMAAWGLARSPSDRWLELALLALLGLAGWTFVEYVLHRFVLHGLRPLRDWHTVHHLRPTVPVGTPPVLGVALIATLVILPALLLVDAWRAGALALGLTSGYLVYSITHHAIHHGHARFAWLDRRRALHALHHHMRRPGCFGVTTSFWDEALHSVTLRAPGRAARHRSST
ncbi:sterol desaturase family protein [Caldimonas sp. KR1-144]|uniref:sterol desaturase family protein n=1 Tax=Caldimonas sp. KR1-144 TaxID=3400911 RepID=UPI003C0D528B